MATGELGIEIKNKGILLFGIILLIIGVVASFYSRTEYPEYGRMTYPYQSIGILLVVAGIIFVALGFLYPSHRTPPQKT
jgi:TRAP-type uncharacterized transport system fused permease subunit